MRIIATVRTRNEARNIERFCLAYQFADEILVADGGSEDNTIEIASSLPKVSVRKFHERITTENGLWRNPHGKHLNFLFDWAEELGTDWIIHDDCDSVPNLKLQRDFRTIVGGEVPDFIFIQRIYMVGEDMWLQKLTQPNGGWTAGLYAWRAGKSFKASEVNPWAHYFEINAYKEPRLDLVPPDYWTYHYFCPDIETAEKKRKFYDESGEIPGCLNPLEYGGPLLPLEDWMRE